MAVALVFPGQGSQRQTMLEPVPRAALVDRLLDTASEAGGLDLRAVLAKDDAEALADTRVAQPLLYIADCAWGAEAVERGVSPAAVAGHSLGELAALAVAGVYGMDAGLRLVVERARLMSEASGRQPGAMFAVLGLDSGTIADVVGRIAGVWVANDNAPGQVVVSGTVAGIAKAHDALQRAGARRIVPLRVAGGFHSPLMAEAARSFAGLLERVALRDAEWPVYQNAEPSPTRDAGLIRERLERQMTSPVRWTETMIALRQDGVSVLLECGPGAVLSGLVKRIDGLEAFAVEQDGITAALDGKERP